MTPRILQIDSANFNRIYAVGDIHGCDEALEHLLTYLKVSEKLDADKDLVIFLGDYVDRGPDVMRCIDLLLQFRVEHPNTIFLMGNHEEMFLDFLGLHNSGNGEWYLENGGGHTVQSYGGIIGSGWDGQAFNRKHFLENVLPQAHKDFFTNLHHLVVTPETYFVHGYLHAQRKLDNQEVQDMLWERPVKEGKHHLKKLIVHGHTPYDRIRDHRPYRIGIDTGCVFPQHKMGWLTCLEVKSMKAIQISNHPPVEGGCPSSKARGSARMVFLDSRIIGV